MTVNQFELGTYVVSSHHLQASLQPEAASDIAGVGYSILVPSDRVIGNECLRRSQFQNGGLFGHQGIIPVRGLPRYRFAQASCPVAVRARHGVPHLWRTRAESPRRPPNHVDPLVA